MIRLHYNSSPLCGWSWIDELLCDIDDTTDFHTHLSSETMQNLTSQSTWNITQANYAFQDALIQFKHIWNHLLGVFIPLEFAVVCIGLLGNIVALTTLALSSKMRTPSFVYHRALVGADLVFCINFFLNYITDRWMTVKSAGCENVEDVQYVFRYWLGAFYSGILYAALNNTCGFLIIYITLIIALERTLALLFYKRYRYWNYHSVAVGAVGLAVVLSVGVNCWSLSVERLIVAYPRASFETPFNEPCWNESIVYQWELRENVSAVWREALNVRSGYNSAVRIVYPFLLSLLTFSVFYGLAKRQKRRRRNRSRVSGAFLAVHNPAETSVSISAASALCNSAQRGHRVRQNRGSEKMLFLLMTAVLALAFLHVAAAEAKRILLILFPPDVILKNKVGNDNLSIQERLSYFQLLLYGHQISRLVANFCTAIDRCFICILHMAMNKLFRQEVLALFRKVSRKWSGRGIFRDKRKRGTRQVNNIDDSMLNALSVYYSQNTNCSEQTAAGTFLNSQC